MWESLRKEMEHTNKQARADVRVRVGRIVVAIEKEQAAVRSIIPVVAADAENTPARIRVHEKPKAPHKLRRQSRRELYCLCAGKV